MGNLFFFGESFLGLFDGSFSGVALSGCVSGLVLLLEGSFSVFALSGCVSGLVLLLEGSFSVFALSGCVSGLVLLAPCTALVGRCPTPCKGAALDLRGGLAPLDSHASLIGASRFGF